MKCHEVSQRLLATLPHTGAINVKARIASHALLLCCLTAAACTDENKATPVQPSLDVRVSRANAAPVRNSDRDDRGASHRYSDETDSTLFDMASSGDTVFIVGLKLPGTRSLTA